MAQDDGGHGGRRAGAGRPKGATLAPADVRARYASARADKEQALAEIRQLEARKARGEVIEAARIVLSFHRAGVAFRDTMLR